MAISATGRNKFKSNFILSFVPAHWYKLNWPSSDDKNKNSYMNSVGSCNKLKIRIKKHYKICSYIFFFLFTIFWRTVLAAGLQVKADFHKIK